MHLYELSERFKNIQATIETDDGTFDEDTLRQTLMETTLLFEEKVESIAKIMKGLDASVTAFKTESERFAQKAKSAQNKYDWLKNYLMVEMVNAKQEKVNGCLLSVTLKTNPPSCIVEDETKIPTQYFRIIPAKQEVDKSTILTDFKKTGCVPDGVSILTDKKTLMIK
jgi:hypothetical protein